MEQWTKEQWEEKKKIEQVTALYLYTPMCGTCAVASKMLEVVTTLKPQLVIGKIDLNYEQSIAQQYEIESVPCLLLSKHGEITEKVYAFRSIQHLLQKIDE